MKREKILVLINKACIVATFLFAGIDICFGPAHNITPETVMENIRLIDSAPRIEELREESHHLGFLLNFAVGSARTFDKIFFFFLLVVLCVCWLNLIFIRKMKNNEVSSGNGPAENKSPDA